MDPLSLGVAQFHQALRQRLQPPAPGADASCAMRLIVDGVTPGELFKSLRLYEFRQDNLYPFVIFTESIESEVEFASAALSQLVGDERSIREGLAEDGRTIPRTALNAREHSAAGLAAALGQLATAVATELAGLVVVLAPNEVRNREAYTALATALAHVAASSPLVVLIRDHGIAAITQRVPARVSLHVDRKALAEYVKNLKSPHDVGPRRENQPQLTAPQRRELEQKLGKRLLTKNTGQELKRLLFEAAEAQSEGKFELAAKRFRMARTFCFVTGYRQEQAMCAIAVGTAQFSCGRLDRAIEAYREGRALGVELGAKALVMQAEIGIATTYLTEKQYPLAREAYGRVFEAADGLVPMQVEALRMQAECLVAEQNMGAAIAKWREALARARQLAPELRAATAERVVAKRLQDFGVSA